LFYPKGPRSGRAVHLLRALLRDAYNDIVLKLWTAYCTVFLQAQRDVPPLL